MKTWKQIEKVFAQDSIYKNIVRKVKLKEYKKMLKDTNFLRSNIIVGRSKARINNGSFVISFVDYTPIIPGGYMYLRFNYERYHNGMLIDAPSKRRRLMDLRNNLRRRAINPPNTENEESSSFESDNIFKDLE